MKEENKDAANSSWRRIFKKKWFFPALYLALAAFLLTGVIWYQSMDNQLKSVVDDPKEEQKDEDTEPPYDEDATSVIDQQEVVKMPVHDQDLAEIVTTFYDYNAPQEDQESGVTRFNNSYYQSPGIDITHADEKEFEAKAAISGTVEEVKKDPLLGNVVVMEHENDITTYYASLSDVKVDAGARLKQGETLGTAGKNLFGKDIGTHLHFQVRKNGQKVNPETYFNQPLSKLDALSSGEDTDESEEGSEDSDGNEENEENEETEETEDDSENDSDLDEDDMNDNED